MLHSKANCRFIPLSEYHSLAERGIDGVVQYVNSIRKNFKGDRIAIETGPGFVNSWAYWSKLTAVPWRHRTGKQLSRALRGKFLTTFAAMQCTILVSTQLGSS